MRRDRVSPYCIQSSHLFKKNRELIIDDEIITISDDESSNSNDNNQVNMDNNAHAGKKEVGDSTKEVQLYCLHLPLLRNILILSPSIKNLIIRIQIVKPSGEMQ